MGGLNNILHHQKWIKKQQIIHPNTWRNTLKSKDEYKLWSSKASYHNEHGEIIIQLSEPALSSGKGSLHLFPLVWKKSRSSHLHISFFCEKNWVLASCISTSRNMAWMCSSRRNIHVLGMQHLPYVWLCISK